MHEAACKYDQERTAPATSTQVVQVGYSHNNDCEVHARMRAGERVRVRTRSYQESPIESQYRQDLAG